MNFKGAWIEAELLQRTDLSSTEKLLLGYCASFTGKCFASNGHIAERLGMPEKTVRNVISGLRTKGIIQGREFPKTGQFLQNVLKTGHDCPENGTIDISIEQRIELSKKFPNLGQRFVSQKEYVELMAYKGFSK